MSLIKLIEHFENRTDLPIEVSEVRDEIIAMGIQDEIVIVGKSADPKLIWGAFNRYTKKNCVYSPPELVTVVAYNSNLATSLQRVVCCKELVHIFDREEEQTETIAEVETLLAKLIPGSTETDDFNLVDIKVLKDQIALYQSLPLLFPKAAREAALRALNEGRHTAETIAARVAMPLSLVKLVLSEEWPGICDDFLDGC